MALDMNDEFFKNLFADDDDALGDIFKTDDSAEETPAKEEPKEAPAEEDVDIEMKTVDETPAEAAKQDPAEETPVVEEAAEPEAEPATKEQDGEETIAEAQDPELEAEEPETAEATAEADVKVEVEVTDGADEQPAADDTSAGTGDEAVADAEAPVEADAPAAEEAAAAESAEPAVEEPVVEVTVTKPKRHRRTKKEMQAARAKEAAEKAAAEKAKSEKKTDAAEEVEEVEIAPEAPINESFIDSLILCLGPKYEAFRKDVSNRISNITVQPGMAPAVIANMIALNNELDNKLFNEGQGYIDAYLSLTDKETGLMTRIREMTMDTAEGSSSDKKRACMHALMNYTFPATGEKINLIQYANALKQATGFISNAKAYTKSTSVALATMMKVA